MSFRLAYTVFAVLIPLIVIQAALSAEPLQLGSVQSHSSESEDGIALAPTRFELIMKPGTDRTVIVNVIYRAESGSAEPFRLVSYQGDWDILADGNVEFYRPNTRSNSASSWLIYSPSEVTAIPGKSHPIRVTVSVPPDAKPGDHLAALLIEARPDNIKMDENRRQVILRFRMAAVFYISIPELTRKGSLENLQVRFAEESVVIIPTLKNEGNSHIRPVHSAVITDRDGSVVAELGEGEIIPVLGKSRISPHFKIEKRLAPGSYSLRYRIDFKDGSDIVEGHTRFEVPAEKRSRPGR